MINPEIAAKAAAAVGSLPWQCRTTRLCTELDRYRYLVSNRGRSSCCGRGKEEEREERPWNQS